MKNGKLLSILLLISLFGWVACEKKSTDEPQQVLPTQFTVDIPDAISAAAAKKSGLKGDEVYRNLRTFIRVGEDGAQAVQTIITAISSQGLDRVGEFTYRANDQRQKRVVVSAGSTFEGKTYAYELKFYDIESASSANDGLALQIFWNVAPVHGVAIMHLNRLDSRAWASQTDAMVRVDYTEQPTNGYERSMWVSVSGWDFVVSDIYGIDNLKMFVGKSGNRIDVKGNSNHPNAYFLTTQKGYNWAFVASADAALNIGVAEVGLPFSTVNATDRSTLLDQYSIYNVLTRELETTGAPAILIDAVLQDAKAPGFFDQSGFVSSETAPANRAADYEPLLQAIEPLVPYNPTDVAGLQLVFGTK